MAKARKRTPTRRRALRVLAVDIGGSHVKALLTGASEPRRFESGPGLTPRQMVAGIRELTRDWKFDVVAIGYPGVVWHGRPAVEPANLGRGWVGFDYEAAFGCPVRMINDAAMQAIGSYTGGRMLFLGLGTGLGTTLIIDDVVEAMELGHLPYRKGHTFEDYLGETGLQRLGRHRWGRAVHDVVDRLVRAFEVDYVVLGGGNVRLLKTLPANAQHGDNANAFKGGFRLWSEPHWCGAERPAAAGRPRRRR